MININKLVIFFGSLLYPIYFVPFSFKYIINNERFGYFMVSFLMGSLAYLMIPYDTMDIVRHYDKFVLFENINFDELLLEGRFVDYVFNIYAWIIMKIGLKKEFIPFSVTLISYYFYFITLKIVIDNELKGSSKNIVSYKYIIILGFFFLINEIRFMDASSGLRNIFSFSMLSYAIINFIYNKKYFTLIMLSLIAIGLHFSALIALLIFILSSWVKCRTFYKLAYLISYIFLLFGVAESVFYLLISKLEPYLREYNLYFPSYFDEDGIWGAGYYLGQNIKSLIFEKYIKLFPLYISGLYFFIFKNFKNEVLYRYLVLLFIFVSLVSVSRTILDRFNWFLVIVFIYFLIIELIDKRISIQKKLYVLVFSLSIIVMDLGSIYKYSDVFWRSWSDLLYIPLILKFDSNITPSQYIIRNSGE